MLLGCVRNRRTVLRGCVAHRSHPHEEERDSERYFVSGFRQQKIHQGNRMDQGSVSMRLWTSWRAHGLVFCQGLTESLFFCFMGVEGRIQE